MRLCEKFYRLRFHRGGMSTIQRSALIAYSAESMFNLVNDVQAYPEFLPGCAESRIDEQSANAMTASLLRRGAGLSSQGALSQAKRT